LAYPLLKALHFIGLALLVGGPAFWYWISGHRGRPGTPGWAGRAAWAAGLLVFVGTGLLDAARAAKDLWGPVNAADVVEFLQTARFGRVVLVRSALAAAFFTVALLGPARALGKGLLLLLGAGVIVSVSVTGHAASGGGLGLLADAVRGFDARQVMGIVQGRQVAWMRCCDICLSLSTTSSWPLTGSMRACTGASSRTWRRRTGDGAGAASPTPLGRHEHSRVFPLLSTMVPWYSCAVPTGLSDSTGRFAGVSE